MNEKTAAYLRFLRFCLDDHADIPAEATSIDWDDLYDFGKKQSIIGVLWQGVSRMGTLDINKPTDDQVMTWMAAVTKIEKRNRLVNEKSEWVTRNFQSEGFRSCLLKGQGNATMYAHPEWRMSGDIDIWVEGDDETVIAYVDSIRSGKKRCYHHIEFLSTEHIPIEVHYRPSWLNNPVNNHRLQQWFSSQADEQFSQPLEGGFRHPTYLFNVVFQLCHVANHVLHEGVGLRQVVDYYYLLRQQEADRRLTMPLLKRLGLAPFAAALTWILAEKLGLDERYWIYTPDQRRGESVFAEILAGGNFGHHDDRTLSGSYANAWAKNAQRLVRDARLALYFPSEALSEPVFRIWHALWRYRHRYRKPKSSGKTS